MHSMIHRRYEFRQMNYQSTYIVHDVSWYVVKAEKVEQSKGVLQGKERKIGSQKTQRDKLNNKINIK